MAFNYDSIYSFLITSFDRLGLEEILAKFLSDMESEARDQFIATLPPRAASYREYADAVLKALQLRGMLDQDFFSVLVAARPRLSDKIRAIAKEHGYELASPTSPTSPTSPKPAPGPSGPVPRRRVGAALLSAVVLLSAAFTTVNSSMASVDEQHLSPANDATEAPAFPNTLYVPDRPVPPESPIKVAKLDPPPPSPREEKFTHRFEAATGIVHNSVIEFVFSPRKAGTFSLRALGTWTTSKSANPDDHVVLMVCDLIDPTKKCQEVEIYRLGTHTDSPFRAVTVDRPVRVILANPHTFDVDVSKVKIEVKRIN